MEELAGLLLGTPPGRVSNIGALEGALPKCWDQLSGDDGGMRGDKVLGRMEDVVWDPPRLRFVIERHGGTVLGSTRAELQRWEVNVEARTATLSGDRHSRQVAKAEPPLDVGPMADEIVSALLNRRQVEWLKWYRDGSVRLLIRYCIPAGSAFQQTLTGRRKRLRNAISARLPQTGFVEVRPNVYRPQP